jgi:acetyl esterase/lipase
MHDDSIAVSRDIAFADRPTGPLLLDLYTPTRTVTPTPVVIWLHGGAWLTGDRTLAPDLRRWFAARGIAMASIEYRLSGVAAFPAQLHDVRSAFRFLRSRAADWHLDPRRIGVWGSSAGGHLAALTALTGHLDQLPGETERGDGSVSAVAESYGPADLTDAPPTWRGGSPSPEAALLGGPPADLPDTARAASPVYQVTAAAPPFQISHGTADAIVPCDHSERLHRALIGAGADSTLYLVDGYRHGFLNPGGRIEADLGAHMDDGRLEREVRAPALVRGADLADSATTFAFDDIGDFFVRHLVKGPAA